ncbi:MAG TPA: thiamine pyrophosphate-dependent enzyme [Anaerovoracaceae bacterium]|nr:thiamine pyrophosphate-dependent enzyme [Anaerovoracaceae bacterium]
MNKLVERYIKKESLPYIFCPGCGNGIILNSAIGAIHELGIKEDTACVSGIGCSSWIPPYLDMDVMHTIHGRAIAFAEGLKLSQPKKNIVVFTGDGDCLAIGGNHLLHAANRNINLTVIMVNNYIYGMTGGQKSPTTPAGSKTKTSPFGAFDDPMDGCRIAMNAGATYCSRWTVSHPIQLKNAIKEGIQHNGFSFIEVLSPCPVQAGKSVFDEREAWKIMEIIKGNTVLTKEWTDCCEDGKTLIGNFKKNTDKIEYTDKLISLKKKIRNEVI